jgi:hypothetical protein
LTDKITDLDLDRLRDRAGAGLQKGDQGVEHRLTFHLFQQRPQGSKEGIAAVHRPMCRR